MSDEPQPRIKWGIDDLPARARAALDGDPVPRYKYESERLRNISLQIHQKEMWSELKRAQTQRYAAETEVNLLAGEIARLNAEVLALQDAVAGRQRLYAALRELVRLKDGPRDDAYRAAKDAAWKRARDVLRESGGRYVDETTSTEPSA